MLAALELLPLEEGDGDELPAESCQLAPFHLRGTSDRALLREVVRPVDFDADTDVDCSDWLGFVSVWTAGPYPAIPKCAGPDIPAISLYGVLAMAGLLGVAGVAAIRRRRERPDQ